MRSTGEVLMHIAGTNYYLLGQMGHKLPEDFDSVDVEKTATDKAKVIEWLKRSIDAVKEAHAAVKEAHANVTPAELRKAATIMKLPATYEGLYLRILVHANEHMGQPVAYARMNGIVPPWSDKK